MTAPPPVGRIEYVSVDDLQPHPDNPNEGDVGAISQSIERVGFYGAIVVQAPSGRRRKHRILAGEHRWLAAKAAGIETVPVSVLDVDDQTALVVLAGDNEIARLAQLDADKRIALLTRIAEAGDLSGTGVDGDDLDALIETARARDEDQRRASPADDEVPDDAPTVCQPGDVWQLGPHTLICGDSTDPDVVTRALDGRKIDLVVTSPPYNVGVNYRGDHHDDQRLPWSEYGAFLHDVVAAFLPHLPKGRAIAWNIWVVADTHWARQAVMFDDLGCHQVRVLVWQKVGVPVPTWHNTRSAERVRVFWPNLTHELVLVLSHGSETLQASKRAATVDDLFENDVFKLAQSMATRDLDDEPTAELTGAGSNLTRRSRKAHPAAYPVTLPRALAGMLADPGAVVFDPFSGAGSTIIGADVANRVGVGVELLPRFCDVTLKRWQRHHGAPPERNGEPVDFLAD